MIAVRFSCGAASAVAAKLTLEAYDNVRIVNTPIAEEDPDNRRFLRDIEAWIGAKIETALPRKYPSGACDDVWRKERYMSGVNGAKCTVELKKKSRQEWQKIHNPDWHVLGFTSDERKRYERFIKTETDRVIPILIDKGLSKQTCVNIIADSGIRLPNVYSRGYPNANCIGCVKATSPTYWNHVRRDAPNVFKERARLSRELGVKLARHNGRRVFLDDLPSDATGAPMKSLTIECGLFCEEPTEEE